ncbi:MAG: molybdopterin-dependent oxidoreductase [Thaumarchaeota archaeon]|nr:molybdopterin-dependent oxidoreductase [Nitrososphaerota archaeon]
MPYLPELASSALFSLVPGSLESKAVENLGPLAKETAFVAASVLNAVVLGLIPVGLQRLGRLQRNNLRGAIVFVGSAYAIMLALGALFLSLTQVSTQPINLGLLALNLLFPSLVFGAILGRANLFPRPPAPPLFPMRRGKSRYNRKRRLFLKSAVGATVGAVLLYYGIGLLFPKQSPLLPSQEASQILAAGVTPNNQFYRVDINVIAPSVDLSAWKLKLHGLVSNPMTLDYNQLLALPSVEEYATLECVSNEVGGDLMSTALWKGVKLKDLLRMVGVGPGADYVVFTCFDGYDVGIPLDKAMADGTILAFVMNGETLPKDHGYPVRAIVPGLYGMMNAKWITDIELVSGVHQGFWQRRGWTNTAAYQTSSWTVTPGDSGLRDRFSLPLGLTDVAGNPIAVVGVAFAGDRGIQKVEVSTDRGNSWQPASLHDPLSKYTWVFWKFDWNPPSSGNYQIMVRATDGTGRVQVATMADPFPNGATGLEVVDVKVLST